MRRPCHMKRVSTLERIKTPVNSHSHIPLHTTYRIMYVHEQRMFIINRQEEIKYIVNYFMHASSLTSLLSSRASPSSSPPASISLTVQINTITHTTIPSTFKKSSHMLLSSIKSLPFKTSRLECYILNVQYHSR